MDYKEKEVKENITVQYDERNSLCDRNENEYKEENDEEEGS